MRKKIISLLFFLSVIGLMLLSQSFVWFSPTGDCTEIKASKPNGTKSHFFGLNCMSCHKTGRPGKSCFTLAGSVLDEARGKIYKNPVIKLYTEPKGAGKLVATILGDKLGNFYTSEKIDFSMGLYPTLVGTPGVKEPIKHMTRPIFKGNCNSCHGYREEALGID